MKVETYIIDSMPSSSAGGAVILVILDVETFKINISDFFIFYSCHFSWSRDAYLQSSFIIFYHVHVTRVCAQLCDHQCLRFTFLSMDDE
jgi:hypothetical protein